MRAIFAESNEIVNDATSFRQIYEHVEAAALIANLL
jgi:hypothetical protein